MQATIWNTKASLAHGTGVVSQARVFKCRRSLSGGFWAVVFAVAHGNPGDQESMATAATAYSMLPTDFF